MPLGYSLISQQFAGYAMKRSLSQIFMQICRYIRIYVVETFRKASSSFCNCVMKTSSYLMPLFHMPLFHMPLFHMPLFHISRLPFMTRIPAYRVLCCSVLNRRVNLIFCWTCTSLADKHFNFQNCIPLQSFQLGRDVNMMTAISTFISGRIHLR